MKIELAPTVAPNLELRMQDGGAVGFTEMLALADQAIRFDGIGVFGLAAATTGYATATAATVARALAAVDREATMALPAPAASVRHDVAGPDTTANSLETAKAATTARASARALARAESPRPATAADIETGLFEVSNSMEPTSPAGSARAPDSHRSPQKIVERVRLEPNDPTGASVVVGGAVLSPEEADRFRARAETLLREHGLSLRNLILFGGAHGAAAPSQRSPRSWR